MMIEYDRLTRSLWSTVVRTAAVRCDWRYGTTARIMEYNSSSSTSQRQQTTRSRARRRSCRRAALWMTHHNHRPTSKHAHARAHTPTHAHARNPTDLHFIYTRGHAHVLTAVRYAGLGGLSILLLWSYCAILQTC